MPQNSPTTAWGMIPSTEVVNRKTVPAPEMRTDNSASFPSLIFSCFISAKNRNARPANCRMSTLSRLGKHSVKPIHRERMVPS